MSVKYYVLTIYVCNNTQRDEIYLLIKGYLKIKINGLKGDLLIHL